VSRPTRSLCGKGCLASEFGKRGSAWASRKIKPVVNALDEAVRLHNYSLEFHDLMARPVDTGAGCPGAWRRFLCVLHLTA